MQIDSDSLLSNETRRLSPRRSKLASSISLRMLTRLRISPFQSTIGRIQSQSRSRMEFVSLFPPSSSVMYEQTAALPSLILVFTRVSVLRLN
ncbi:hypothetical protein PENTCL1PPCAC_22404 [Pristionchus entomophagus]|uniref:Uncharacterized protein n=1 Tax=Pristionchus entomophagus TaxID=358040 RepID=A0AAV5U093_9BILA|nr:hypothetical protein PENTCL1PPCAC_22404 [Pristionchus entomophagus]